MIETITSCNNSVETEVKETFAEKKKRSNLLIKSFNRLGYTEKVDKVKWCGYALDFRPVKDSDSFKLDRAKFCKNRLCPMCAWRRSKKVFGQVSQVMELIEDKYEFILLTLTIPNVKANKLSAAIDRMQDGFRKMKNYSSVKIIMEGYFKALEITYNRKTDTYHPHYHVIIAVPKNYFRSNFYISQERWLFYWQKAMKDKSIKMVDVRKIKSKNDCKGLGSVVAEVAKYAVKDSDYLFADDTQLTDKVVKVFDSVLYKRRLCSFGGCFKSAQQILGHDDCMDGDLVNTDNSTVSEEKENIVYRYCWDFRHYRYYLACVFVVDKVYINSGDILYDYDTGEVME